MGVGGRGFGPTDAFFGAISSENFVKIHIKISPNHSNCRLYLDIFFESSNVTKVVNIRETFITIERQNYEALQKL